MNGQLSLSDCFITLNGLRKKYNLVELYDGDVIIPPGEIENEREKCLYWQYYDKCCLILKIPTLCFEDWKKEKRAAQHERICRKTD